MKLWHKVIIGLVLGVIFGFQFPEYVDYIKPIGDVFLKLIKMIITPMIFFTLVAGMTSLSDPSALGRVGLKATLAFLLTSSFAVVFGMIVAIIFQPGKGVELNFGSEVSSFEAKDFKLVEFLMDIIPSNVFETLAGNNILQVVFFAVFTGITINKMGSSTYHVKNLINTVAKIVLRMVGIVIKLSPYAAFALTAWVIGKQGPEILMGLIKLCFAVTIAMILQYFIFGLLIFVFCRMSPIPFYKKSIPYQLLAFSTSSSKATLPTTMEISKKQLGISDPSVSFILPLGASINMDGLAINLGLTAIFFAQVFDVTLQLHDYFMIVLTATLGSIGGAGIPGASIIMLPMVLSSVNLPIEGVAIIVGIDRILDMLRTTINITGDATVTLIVDHSEGTFDKEKYFS